MFTNVATLEGLPVCTPLSSGSSLLGNTHGKRPLVSCSDLLLLHVRCFLLSHNMDLEQPVITGCKVWWVLWLRLFPQLKMWHWGQCFATVEDSPCSSAPGLHTIPKESSHECFLVCDNHWSKCERACADRKCFEGALCTKVWWLIFRNFLILPYNMPYLLWKAPSNNCSGEM